jgi:hypothetical protein
VKPAATNGASSTKKASAKSVSAVAAATSAGMPTSAAAVAAARTAEGCARTARGRMEVTACAVQNGWGQAGKATSAHCPGNLVLASFALMGASERTGPIVRALRGSAQSSCG